MTPPKPRIWVCASLAGLALLAADPALAQSGEVGGNIGTFIQNLIDLLNSNVIRGLAKVVSDKV